MVPPVTLRLAWIGIIVACLASMGGEAAHAVTLTWSPPGMTSATTVELTTSKTTYHLDPTRDYVLELPAGLYDKGGLIIEGGRNIRLIGGHIWVPETGATKLGPRRGLLLINQTGRVHLEGLQIDGPGLSEGIQLGQPFGSTVQLQNIYVGRVRARDTVGFTDNHPDVVQTWSGPKRLLIDHLSGSTDLQGLLLDPLSPMCRSEGCRPSDVWGQTWDLRNIDIWGSMSARVLMWKSGDFRLGLQNLWAWQASGRSMAASLLGSIADWPGLTWGPPPERIVSPADVGLDYQQASSYRY